MQDRLDALGEFFAGELPKMEEITVLTVVRHCRLCKPGTGGGERQGQHANLLDTIVRAFKDKDRPLADLQG